MKCISTFILLLVYMQVCSQQPAFSSKVKNKDLKAQMIIQEKATQEILDIFNADQNAEKYIDELADKEARQFRKEQNLKDNQPIMIARPRLSHKDSVQLKLYNRDALLYEKYKEYCNAYQYIEKLSKADNQMREEFHRQNIQLLDSAYKGFYENKKRTKSVFEKRALYTTNWNVPILLSCEGNADPEKCFGTSIRTEIERKYQMPEFVYYDAVPHIKSKVLFRINKEGKYEVLEIAETTNTYFLDMCALEIAKSLFGNKKVAKPQEDDFYSKIPLTFSFE